MKGYNNRNFLLRVKKINEIYVEHAQRGVPATEIYRRYIGTTFFISRGTFYRYLTIPYKRLLSDE
jgi:hypothetical protein